LLQEEGRALNTYTDREREKKGWRGAVKNSGFPGAKVINIGSLWYMQFIEEERGREQG